VGLPFSILANIFLFLLSIALCHHLNCPSRHVHHRWGWGWGWNHLAFLHDVSLLVAAAAAAAVVVVVVVVVVVAATVSVVAVAAVQMMDS